MIPLSPHLRSIGATKQLYVDGRPFLALGGELGNSSASDLELLEGHFAKLQAMHLNTVMLPVYWDRIEPVEGEFDFGLVQGAIELARRYGLRLVYLWFGTWKNSMSCYAPSWVKRDTARFLRVRRKDGEPQEILSPAGAESVAADARAFAELMRWTKSFDEDSRTVIMVQVENEIGMIPDPRDHSPESEALYRQGTWESEEAFSAWQFATYTDQVAAAGKEAYDLPMFANAALIRPGYQPGQYPSGGPLPHLMEIWQTHAPHLDFLSPDVYFPNFNEWVERYMQPGNSLFVPEIAPSTRAAANALYAFAQHRAIGVGPFAIEDQTGEKERSLTECYGILRSISHLVLQGQAEGRIIGLSPRLGFDWELTQDCEREELAGIVFEARFDKTPVTTHGPLTDLPTLGVGRWETPEGTPVGAAMILQIGEEEFYVVGKGVTLTFSAAGTRVGLDWVREGVFDADGGWVGGRWLNGDETHQGRHVRLPDGRWSVQRFKLYRYR